MKQAKKLICSALLVCFLLPQLSSAQDDANAILDQIRSAQAQISRPLSGRLRPENGESIPFRLQLKGGEFDYNFANPPETIRLQLNENGSLMTDEKAGGQQALDRFAIGRARARNGHYVRRSLVTLYLLEECQV